jgi:phage baseplate assembly protein W
MPQTTRIFSDLDLDFTAHPVTGDVVKKIDLHAIAGSLNNLLLTNHYERLFKPSMGGNLRRLLFEPMDDLTSIQIRDEIELTINNYEPRVKLEGIEVVPDYDLQQYNVSLTFFIANNPEPITLSLFLERVR